MIALSRRRVIVLPIPGLGEGGSVVSGSISFSIGDALISTNGAGSMGKITQNAKIVVAKNGNPNTKIKLIGRANTWGKGELMPKTFSNLSSISERFTLYFMIKKKTPPHKAHKVINRTYPSKGV